MERPVINVDDLLSQDEGVDEAEIGVPEEGMPEAVDATPDESQDEVPDAETTPTPQVLPKGYVPQKDIDNLRSTYDRQVAEVRRQNQLLQQQLDQQRKDADARDERMLAIETRDMTEDEAVVVRQRYEIERLKRSVEAEKQRVDADKAVLAAERAQTVKENYAVRYSTQYGVPKEFLLDAPTSGPEDMEKWAKHYQQMARQAAGARRREAGTDNIGSGTPARGGMGSLQQLEAAYAAGRITDAQYARARAKFNLD